MLIDQSPAIMQEEFMRVYNSIVPIDIAHAKSLIGDLYYRKKLDEQWYAAIEKGEIDYRVYNDKYYFIDTWQCWARYSRRYLRLIYRSTKMMEHLASQQSIIDLGCGIGYTTAAWKELCSHATVFGTNLPNTDQWTFCSHMAQQYHFNIIPDIGHCPSPINVVFASEYFEHIERPLEHLCDIIHRLKPRIFIFANAFNTHSVGHFTVYKHLHQVFPQEAMSRLFTKTLNHYHYRPATFKFWNNRPGVYIRNG